MITPFVLSLIIFILVGLPLCYMDIRIFRISSPLVITGCVLMLACIGYECYFPDKVFKVVVVKGYAISAVVGLIAYILFNIFSGGKISSGDILFALFACLFLQFPYSLIATGFTGLICLMYYLFFAVRHTVKKGRPMIFRPIFAIPFVPFIFSGTILVKVLFYILR